MKIGILTHQYINNYGAFLQAWALREAISELFPEDEVQIIDYVKPYSRTLPHRSKQGSRAQSPLG